MGLIQWKLLSGRYYVLCSCPGGGGESVCYSKSIFIKYVNGRGYWKSWFEILEAVLLKPPREIRIGLQEGIELLLWHIFLEDLLTNHEFAVSFNTILKFSDLIQLLNLY